MTRIAAVAFDLMDTVLRDPYREALEAATGLSLADLLERRPPNAYPAFERGEITEDEYWASWDRAGLAVDPDAFHAVRRGGYRWLPGMRELLDDLAGSVRRVAASNYPNWVDDLTSTGLLADRFDEVVASVHLGVRKPDAGFYTGLLGRLGLGADEVFFVDDRPANVAAARAAGITAVEFDGAEALRAALRDLGVRAA